MRIVRIAIATAVCLAAVTPTADAVTIGQHFNLNEANSQTNAPMKLSGPNMPQTFGYDNVKNKLYAAQMQNDNNSGESTRKGNLRISKINSSTAKVDSYIVLNGFGHGVSIGVEPSGNANAWLWVETAAPTLAKGKVTFGTRIARVRFASKHTFAYQSGTIVEKDEHGKKVAKTSAKVISALDLSGFTYSGLSVAIDPLTDQVAVRYRTGSTSSRYRVYARADILDGGSLTNLANPSLAASTWPYDGSTSANFQGYALCNGWIYTLTGKKGKNNVAIAAMSIDGGQRISAKQSYSAPKMTKSTQEPEGIAIRVTPDGKPHLRWGLAGVSSGSKKLMIFQKSTMS